MFASQLKKYRLNRNMTRKKLAEELNKIVFIDKKEIDVNNITSWERGTNPRLEIIEAISQVLDIPVQYLFDDSNQALDKIIQDKLPDTNNIIQNTKKVPLLTGYVGAGSTGEVYSRDSANYLYIDKKMITAKYHDRDIKALLVIGDSMIPFVDHNDIVLFIELDRGQYNLPDGKYIITTASGTMVKNLTFKSNGDIVISSCNKAYESELIKANETQEYLDIVGFVVGRILKS